MALHVYTTIMPDGREVVVGVYASDDEARQKEPNARRGYEILPGKTYTVTPGTVVNDHEWYTRGQYHGIDDGSIKWNTDDK